MSRPLGREGLSGVGRYLLSDELILALMDQGQIFDIAKTRNWLDNQRAEGAIPSIDICFSQPGPVAVYHGEVIPAPSAPQASC